MRERESIKDERWLKHFFPRAEDYSNAECTMTLTSSENQYPILFGLHKLSIKVLSRTDRVQHFCFFHKEMPSRAALSLIISEFDKKIAPKILVVILFMTWNVSDLFYIQDIQLYFKPILFYYSAKVSKIRRQVSIKPE